MADEQPAAAPPPGNRLPKILGAVALCLLAGGALYWSITNFTAKPRRDAAGGGGGSQMGGGGGRGGPGAPGAPGGPGRQGPTLQPVRAEVVAGGPVVFALDVKPILDATCVRCHRAGGGGRGRGGPRGGGPPAAAASVDAAPSDAAPGDAAPSDAPRRGGPPGAGPPGGGNRGPGGGLRLDDRAAAMAGGKHGPSIVPGKPDESLMYTLLKGPVTTPDGDELEPMPKPGPGREFAPLSAERIEVIRRWIADGAKWE